MWNIPKNPARMSCFSNILPCSNAYVFVLFQTLKYVEHNGGNTVPSGGAWGGGNWRHIHVTEWIGMRLFI
jgi:hypothetical protein